MLLLDHQKRRGWITSRAAPKSSAPPSVRRYKIIAEKAGFLAVDATVDVQKGSDQGGAPVTRLVLQPETIKVRLIDAAGAALPSQPFRLEKQDGTRVAEGTSDAQGLVKELPAFPGKLRLILLDQPRPLKLRVGRAGTGEQRVSVEIAPGDQVDLSWQVSDAASVRLVDDQGVVIQDGLPVDAKGAGTTTRAVAQSRSFAVVAVPPAGPLAASGPSGLVRVDVSPNPAVVKFKARKQGTTGELDAVDLVAGEAVEFVFQVTGAKQALLMERDGADISFQVGEPIDVDPRGNSALVLRPAKTTSFELLALGTAERSAVSTAPLAVSVTAPRPKVNRFAIKGPQGETARLDIAPGQEVELVFEVEQADLVQLIERTEVAVQSLGAPVAVLRQGKGSLRIIPPGTSEYTLQAIASTGQVVSPESAPVDLNLQVQVRLRLFDNLKQAIPFSPYRLTVANHLPLTGVADEHGFLSESEVPAPSKCLIEWGYPALSEIPGSDQLVYYHRIELLLTFDQRQREEQARKRLTNLGYPPADSLAENLEAFQRDYDLDPPDGELNDTTDKLLKRVHDEGASKDDLAGGK